MHARYDPLRLPRPSRLLALASLCLTAAVGCGPPNKLHVFVTYPPPVRPAAELAHLEADGVQVVDGVELPPMRPFESDVGHIDRFELLPGPHVLIVKQGFMHGGLRSKTEARTLPGGAYRYVQAEPLEVRFVAEPGHYYVLRYDQEALPDKRPGWVKALAGGAGPGRYLYTARVEDLGRTPFQSLKGRGYRKVRERVGAARLR